MKTKYFLIGVIVTFVFLLSAYYAFACEIPEVTPSIAPEISISPEEDITPTETLAPTPTDTPQAQTDAHGDGRSDGLSSCPSCTQAPQVAGSSATLPDAAPAAGRG